MSQVDSLDHYTCAQNMSDDLAGCGINDDGDTNSSVGGGGNGGSAPDPDPGPSPDPGPGPNPDPGPSPDPAPGPSASLLDLYAWGPVWLTADSPRLLQARGFLSYDLIDE